MHTELENSCDSYLLLCHKRTAEVKMAVFAAYVRTTDFSTCRAELHICLLTSTIIHATVYMTCLITFFRHIHSEKDINCYAAAFELASGVMTTSVSVVPFVDTTRMYNFKLIYLGFSNAGLNMNRFLV
jgi:hypothetical protein